MKRLPTTLALAFACGLVPLATTAASPPPAGTGEPEGRISEWEVPTPMTARDPAIAPTGHVYFAVSTGDRVARFDPHSRQFTEWKVPPGTKPNGIVATADGKVYFGGRGNGTIGELDPVTGAVHLFQAKAASDDIYSVAKDSRDDIWFTRRKSGTIGKLDRKTGRISTYPMDGEPYGLAQDKKGRIWVTRIAAGLVSVLDPRTGDRWDISVGKDSRPRRIAIAPDGAVWVTLFGAGRVIRIDADTRRISREFELPGGPTCGPYSVAVDPRGHVWVSTFQTDSIVLLDPATGRFRVFALPNRLSGIRNAVIDARGRYWYLATSLGRLGVIE